MSKKSLKYRRRIGSLFLAAYIAFILIGTIHYHCYDQNPSNSINNEANTGGVTDLNSDFFSVCSLHQFSHTIANSSYTSKDVFHFLSEIEANFFQLSTGLLLLDPYSKTSPRAPPKIS